MLPLPSGYSEITKHTISQMSEAYLHPGLIVELLKHIKSLNTPGAVLIFLPGWSEIFSLLKHLENHPIFGYLHTKL